MSKEEFVTERASGRVNLIGEHTDYNDGFVFPMALPYFTQARLRVVSRSEEGLVRAKSEAAATRLVEYQLGKENPTHDWADYLQGVTWVLRKEGFSLGSVDVELNSTVPMGSGLSSSAALDVALLRAFRSAFSLPLDDLKIAKLGQRVENDFVGARVGIMDPLAASLGRPNTALFVDTRSLSVEHVPIPTELVDIIVINSGITHKLAAGHDSKVPDGADYNTRRKECEAAATQMGLKSLRDMKGLTDPNFMKLEEKIKARARHVFTENARVVSAVAALRARDMKTLGRLFNESHASMRDDYQVSISEIDQLVDIAQSRKEIFGARLTGGGFGGSIVALAQAGRGHELALSIAEEYSKKCGQDATVLLPSSRSESSSS